MKTRKVKKKEITISRASNNSFDNPLPS